MELPGNIVRIALELAVTIFCAELAAGFVHWAEDAYIRADTPLVGRWVGRPNIIHHYYPRHMARSNWWETSSYLVILAAAIVAIAWCAGLLTWQVWLFAILGANANEVHKWSHRTRNENGPIISRLQDLGILQTPKHHLIHHKDPKNTHYCPITNYVNPILQAIHLWEALEWILARTIGLQRRPDTSIQGAGPAPEWLQELFPRPAKRPVPAQSAHIVPAA